MDLKKILLVFLSFSEVDGRLGGTPLSPDDIGNSSSSQNVGIINMTATMKNYCGKNHYDASKKCVKCQSGLDSECPDGQTCFVGITGCDAPRKERPSLSSMPRQDDKMSKSVDILDVHNEDWVAGETLHDLNNNVAMQTGKNEPPNDEDTKGLKGYDETKGTIAIQAKLSLPSSLVHDKRFGIGISASMMLETEKSKTSDDEPQHVHRRKLWFGKDLWNAGKKAWNWGERQAKAVWKEIPDLGGVKGFIGSVGKSAWKNTFWGPKALVESIDGVKDLVNGDFGAIGDKIMGRVCDQDAGAILSSALPGMLGGAWSVFTNHACPSPWENDVKKIRGATESNKKAIRAVERGVEVAKARIDVNSRRIDRIDTVIARHDQDIRSIQVDITSLHENDRRIRNDISQIRQDVTTIQSNIVSIESDIRGIRGDISSIRTEIGTIKTVIGTINHEINRINQDIAEMEQDIHLLQESDRQQRLELIRQAEVDRTHQQELLRQSEVDQQHQEELLRQRQVDEEHHEELLRQRKVDELLKDELLRQAEEDKRLSGEILRLKKVDQQLLENDRELAKADKQIAEAMVQGFDDMGRRLQQAKVDMMAYTDEKFLIAARVHSQALERIIARNSLPKTHSYEDIFLEADVGEAGAVELGLPGVPILTAFTKIKLAARASLVEFSLVSGSSDATWSDEYHSNLLLMFDSIITSEARLDSVAGFISVSEDPVRDYDEVVDFPFDEYDNLRTELDLMRYPLVEQMNGMNLARRKKIDASSNWENPSGCVAGFTVGSDRPSTAFGAGGHWLEIDLGHEEAIELVVLHGTNLMQGEAFVELFGENREVMGMRKVNKVLASVSYLYFREGATENLHSFSPSKNARFVKISVKGEVELFQVVVYGADRALTKKARQSSTEANFKASNALDGGVSSLSMTQAESSPWWEVDLQFQLNIGAVYFESDGCLTSDPCKFEMILFDSSKNVKEAQTVVDDGMGPKHVIFPNTINAKFIRINLESDKQRHLALKQVKVFGPHDVPAIQAQQAKSQDSEMQGILYGNEFELAHPDAAGMCLDALQEHWTGEVKLTDCRGTPTQQWRLDENHLKLFQGSGDLCMAWEAVSNQLVMSPCDATKDEQNFLYQAYGGLLYFLGTSSWADNASRQCVGVVDMMNGLLGLYECDNRAAVMNWNYAGAYAGGKNNLEAGQFLSVGQFLSSDKSEASSDLIVRSSLFEGDKTLQVDSRKLVDSFFDDELPDKIKTPLISDNKQGDSFDDKAHPSGVHKIFLAWGNQLDGIQLTYRDGVVGAYHGIQNGARLREFSLEQGEDIIQVKGTEHNFAYGMESLSFTTSHGRVIEIASSGENSGAEKVFNAPIGYILGGIHGKTGGVEGSSPITIGIYWVKNDSHQAEFELGAKFDRGIRSVQICHNPRGIYQLKVTKFSDGTTDNSIEFGLKTSSCQLSTIELSLDDYFNQVEVAECPDSVSICFITLYSHVRGKIGMYGSKNLQDAIGSEIFKSPQGYGIGGFFGNAGSWISALGVYYTPLPSIAGPQESHKTGEFRGSSPSVTNIVSFDDGDGMASDRYIKSIYIGDGWWIDGIGSRYDDGSFEYHGGIGGEKNKIDLDPNEYVTKVVVTESFRPQSNRRRILSDQGSFAPLMEGYVELRSTLDSKMCLDVYHGQTADFTSLQMWPCNDTPAQKFYLDGNGRLRSQLKSNYCVEMDPNPSWGGVFMHSACLDSWQVLKNGSLKNIGDSKCMSLQNSATAAGTPIIRETCQTLSRQIWQGFIASKGKDPTFLLGMCEGDCDSDSDCGAGLGCYLRSTGPVPGCTGSAYGNWDYCTNRKYTTRSPTPGPTTEPTLAYMPLLFEVEGSQKSSRLEPFGNGQDGGGTVYVSGNRLTMQGNVWKGIELPSPLQISAETALSVTVEMVKSAEILAICLVRASDITSSYLDPYCFKISGSQEIPGMLSPDEGKSSLMEGSTVRYILPFGKYLAGTTVSFLGFVQDNDADRRSGETLFSDISIWSEPVDYVEFRYATNSAMCLTVKGGNMADFTPLELWDCDGSPAQKFFLDRNGRLRSLLKSAFCVEMDPADWGGVFMHSACIDTWVYSSDGSFLNIGDSKCMAAEESSGRAGTHIVREDCGTSAAQHNQIWAAGSFTPELVGLFIGSLTFETTSGNTYGPYGKYYDNAVSKTYEAPPGYMLGGFHGSRNQYIVGIGFYWVPILPHYFGVDSEGDLSLWRQTSNGKSASRIWSAERDGLEISRGSIPRTLGNQIGFDGSALKFQSEDGAVAAFSKDTQTFLDDRQRLLTSGGLMNVVTTFEDNNGSWGNMFDIVALNNIALYGIDIHTSSTGPVTVEIWTKAQSFVGYESTASSWTKVQETTVSGQGTGYPTPVPHFSSIFISAGSVQAFYVTLNAAEIRYTNGIALGSTYTSNSDIIVREGKGLDGIFGTSGIYSPRVWNGALYYTIITAPPTTVPSPQPTDTPTVSPSHLPTTRPSTSASPTRPAEVILARDGQVLLDGKRVPFTPARESFAFLASMLNNLALDIMTPNQGSPVYMMQKREDDGKEHQKWRLTNDGYLENSWNGLVLEVIKDSGIGTTALEMRAKAGRIGQKWLLTSDNYLQSWLNGLVLAIKNSNTAEQATLVLWSEDDSPSQKWFFSVDNCGCSSCSPSTLSAECMAKIEHLMNLQGGSMTEQDACEQVSNDEPFTCGVHCRPSSCVG